MAHRLGDVARKAGVSEATVSRVLNGRPGVSESTRAAVLTALDVLGYERPTQLRGERARLVGLVLPELENPIFPALAEVVGGGLAQQGFTTVLCTRTAGGLSEAAYVSMLIQQQVSGVVFAGGQYAEDDSPHEHYRLLKERGVPVMLVNAAPARDPQLGDRPPSHQALHSSSHSGYFAESYSDIASKCPPYLASTPPWLHRRRRCR